MIGSGLLALAALGQSCVKPKPGPIRIGYNVFPGHGLLSFAERKGFFREVGVDVELREFSSFSAIVQAYEAGRLDALALSLSGFLQMAQKTPTAKAVILLAYSEGADGLIAHPEIRSLNDLRGKRVGVSLWAVSEYLLARMLQRSGIRREEITLVNLTGRDGEQAFRRREIDAWLTSEPWLTQMVRQIGATVLFTSRDLPEEIADVLVMDDSLLRHRRPECRRILQAYFRAVEYGRAHPEEIVGFFAERLGISRPEARAALERIRFLDRTENRDRLGTPSGLHALRQVVEAHHRTHVIREVGDVTALFDLALIREVP